MNGSTSYRLWTMSQSWEMRMSNESSGIGL